MNRPTPKLETDLNTLRSLVAVVEEGGFSAATKRIHRTQSAISVQIAKLEDQLKAKLLERTSRSVALTPEGETFLSYARRILKLVDEATRAISPVREKDLLRVGFAEYLAPQHLDTVLNRFQEQNPSCDVSLVLGLGPPLLDMLKDGKLDLVIAGPEGAGGTVLWEEPLVWTGTYDESSAPPEPMKLVLMPPPCIYRKVTFDKLTETSLPWRISIEANSFEAVQSSIRAGLGMTVLPITAIKDNMPVVRDLLPDLPTTTVESYLRKDQNHSFTRPFIDFLIESFKKSS